jgi:UDP-N-acetylmuramate--alanine ligase
VVRERDGETRRIADVTLPMPGRHNVQNALSAVAVGLEMGMTDEQVAQGFVNFGGVKRRFTKVGTIATDTGEALVIDDYGHHPVEIRAVLSAAREGAKGRVIAVAQPHRFTRLRDHMDDFQQCFNDADIVFVTPVYAAGEAPIDGTDSAALIDGVRARGHRQVGPADSFDDLVAKLAAEVRGDDIIVCLGAGDITKWAAGLAQAVSEARG